VSGPLREATPDDLSWVWPAACSSHLFADFDRFEAWRSVGPWRVRVTDRGEAAIVDRWREDLDILAVRGLWCSRGRVPVLLEQLRSVAVEHGFASLLGPLVDERELGPYLAAGMKVRDRVVTWRLDDLSCPGVGLVDRAGPDVSVREGRAGDLGPVARVDAECFDPFWRYDATMLTDYAAHDRLAVAERNGRTVGYTLSTVRGREGSLGRLAVAPSERRQGIGGTLLADAVGALARAGVGHVVLCTQEDNRDSCRLYAAAGFRELPGRLVSTVSGPLAGGRS
jgi:ribosomal-protein-alanine N-acetyltransferase